MNIQRDIEAASNWLNASIIELPNTQGIYLGLDTLNMEQGFGSNIEIGLSSSCNPNEITDDWAYDCENYGNSHLIKGLYEVSDSFNNEGKWTAGERSFAEYLVFLGYSGVILRSALLQLETKNDFLSVWGFHDGDMFFLVQQIGGLKSIVTAEGF